MAGKESHYHSDEANFFSIEDTSDSCYRDVATALLKRGWKNLSTKKMSKFEKRRLSTVTRKSPKLIWTIGVKEPILSDLLPDQIFNHFDGIGCLTTKNGLSDLLRELYWVSADPAEISPRCYNLGDPSQRSEFIDDFRLTASVNILLQWCIAVSTDKLGYLTDGMAVSNEIRATCVSALQRFIAIKTSGDWWGHVSPMTSAKIPKKKAQVPGLTAAGEEVSWKQSAPSSSFAPAMSSSAASSESPVEPTLGISDEDWEDITKCSYALAAAAGNSNFSLASHFNSSLKHMVSSLGLSSTSSPSLLQTALLLFQFAKINKQFYTSGHRNLWVVKAPEASKGTNIRVFYNLGDILECEKGMSGRTVQKYIERPLLVGTVSTINPPATTTKNFFQKRIYQQSAAAVQTVTLVKFDLRVWVLVTAFQQEGEERDGRVRAYIFNRVYGRRCGQAYSYDVAHVGQSLAHLTNYSIQKMKRGRNRVSVGAGTVVVDPTAVGVEEEGSDDEDGHDDYEEEFDEEDLVDDAATAEQEKVSGQCISPRISEGGTNASRLRSTVSTFRDKSSAAFLSFRRRGAGHASNGKSRSLKENLRQSQQGTDLLVTHEQVMDVLWQACRKGGDGPMAGKFSSGHEAWVKHVWPRICEKIGSLLNIAAQSVQQRDGSFEFLGLDVIVDDVFEPWVLEANMSPALAHRNDEHNAMIAAMAEQMVDIVLTDLRDCPTTLATERSTSLGTWVRLEDVSNKLHDAGELLVDGKTLHSQCGVLSKDFPLLEDYFGYHRVGAVARHKRLKKVHYPRRGARNLFAALYRRASSCTADGVDCSDKRGAGSNQWNTSVVPMRPRSASASRRRPSSANASRAGGNARGVGPSPAPLNLQFTSHFDVNFAAVGKEIGYDAVRFADGCCVAFGSVLLLQRWARRYLTRVRLFYARREALTETLQCCVRQFLSRNKLNFLRRKRAVVVLQCMWRQRLARNRRSFVARTKAATCIQKYVRRCQAIAFCVRVRQHYSASSIQKWIRRIVHRRKCCAGNIIIRIVKRWLIRRNVLARKITLIVLRHYGRRNIKARRIGRSLCRAHRKWKLHICRMKRLKHAVAEEACPIAIAWRQRVDDAIEKEERERRVCEELEAVRLAEEEAEKKFRGLERMDHLYAMWKEVVGIEDSGGGTFPAKDKDTSNLTSRSAICSGSHSKVSLHLHQTKQMNVLSPSALSEDPYSLEHFMSKYEEMSTSAASENVTNDRKKLLEMIADYETSSASTATACTIQIDTVEKSKQDTREVFNGPLSSGYKNKGNIYFDDWIEDEFTPSSDKKAREGSSKCASTSSSTKKVSKMTSSTTLELTQESQTDLQQSEVWSHRFSSSVEHDLRCGRCNLSPCQCRREVHNLFIPTTRPPHHSNKTDASESQQHEQIASSEITVENAKVGEEAMAEVYDDYDSELQRFFDKIEARKHTAKQSHSNKSKSIPSKSLAFRPSENTSTMSTKRRNKHVHSSRHSDDESRSKRDGGDDVSSSSRRHSQRKVTRANERGSTADPLPAAHPLPLVSSPAPQEQSTQWATLQAEKFFEERLHLLESIQPDHLREELFSTKHQDSHQTQTEGNERFGIDESTQRVTQSNVYVSYAQRADWQASLDGYFNSTSSRAIDPNNARGHVVDDGTEALYLQSLHLAGVERVKQSLRERKTAPPLSLPRGDLIEKSEKGQWDLPVEETALSYGYNEALPRGGGVEAGDSWQEGWGAGEGEVVNGDCFRGESIAAHRTRSRHREKTDGAGGGGYYGEEDFLYDFSFDMNATRNTSSGQMSASKRPESTSRYRPKSASVRGSKKMKTPQRKMNRKDGPAIRY